MRYDATYLTSGHAYIVYYIVYDIVCLTYNIVRQNTVLASRTCDIVYDVVYDIVYFLDDIDIVRFLPVLASRTCDIVYDIVRFLRCRIRCAMQHSYYTISNVRF